MDFGYFPPFSVTNEQPEISALFPGKRADFSFSAWAEGGGRRADFTKGPHMKYCRKEDDAFYHTVMTNI